MKIEESERARLGKIFWSNVEKRLILLDLPRKALAIKARIDASVISKGIFENHLPRTDVALRIAMALGTTVEELCREAA